MHGRRHGQSPHDQAHDHVHDLADELCATVLGSLRRRDQRERGQQYVHGLLATRGRKSIRNIAVNLGQPEAEQSLHHFIASSPWDWRPIRATLAQHLAGFSPLTAWVTQPMAIPKGGKHSVGAGRHFDPHQGQMFRGQQAFGTWFASPDIITPVDWRLHLPRATKALGTAAGPDGPRAAWAPDTPRAAWAPDTPKDRYLRYQEYALAGALNMVGQGVTPTRPVVLDISDIGTRATMNRFAEAKVPVLARTSATAPLFITDPTLPGHRAGTMSAQDILRNVRGLRTRAYWSDPAAPGLRRDSLVATVRVMMPDPAASRRRELLLLGEWTNPSRPPSQYWITDLTRLTPAALLRMTKLPRRVALTAQGSVRDLGVRDFVGRSLPGWHRHVTMVSIAHAAHCLWTQARGAAVSAGCADCRGER